MRCVTCRTTGYTEDELLAHEKKSGHRRPKDGSHATSRDFPPSETPKTNRAEILAALEELGITAETLAALADAKASADDAESPAAAVKNAGAA